MKNEYLKIGNTAYHLPTYGPMSFKDFQKEFPDHRGSKEVYDLIYLEYHGKPYNHKSKPVKEKVVEVEEQPTIDNGSGDMAIPEQGV